MSVSNSNSNNNSNSNSNSNPYYCFNKDMTCQQHDPSFFETISVFDRLFKDAYCKFLIYCGLRDIDELAYEFKKTICYWSLRISNQQEEDRFDDLYDECEDAEEDLSSDLSLEECVSSARSSANIEGFLKISSVLDDAVVKCGKHQKIDDNYHSLHEKEYRRSRDVFLQLCDLERVLETNPTSVLDYLDDVLFLMPESVANAVDNDENRSTHTTDEYEDQSVCFGAFGTTPRCFEQLSFDLKHWSYGRWRTYRLHLIASMYLQSLKQDGLQLARLETKYAGALKSQKKAMNVLSSQKRNLVDELGCFWYYGTRNSDVKDIVEAFAKLCTSEHYVNGVSRKSVTMLEHILLLKVEVVTLSSEIEKHLVNTQIDCEWLESSLKSYIVFVANMLLLIDMDGRANYDSQCRKNEKRENIIPITSTHNRTKTAFYEEWIKEKAKLFSESISQQLSVLKDDEKRANFETNLKYIMLQIDMSIDAQTQIQRRRECPDTITTSLKDQFITI